jgi:GH24 family phage-related lysozyme (muramidase)
MSLFKIKKTGEIGFFSNKLRPSYDMYHRKVYYYLNIVDPTTDWEIASEPRYYKFTGDKKRVDVGELIPLSLKDLKKAQKNDTIDVLLKPELIKENAEMSLNDIHKIVKYSSDIQQLFSTQDNLEDWVKAKLNHACDYVATVRDYLKFYHSEKQNIDKLTEEVKSLEQKFDKKKLDVVFDGVQHALDVVGLEPTIGSVADGSNAIISLLRSALEKEKNEKKKHLLNAAISAVSIIPFGDLAKIIKLRSVRKPTVKLLKFIKKYLKSQKPSYSDALVEKWSTIYKNNIDCNNAKGFSQKAHCRARKLRQSGRPTSSKSIREIYKEVTNQLLKEFNSNMAMGALKQINNDAKELQSMLQPDDQLEDWVKSKLNLAGEYLDDVYHHLDYFGPDGRKLDEVRVAKKLKEGWKDWVAAGAIGLSALKGDDLQAAGVKVAGTPTSITQTQQKSSFELNQSFIDYIKRVENAGKTGYDSKKKLWFPHKSFEGGSDTIGYGHKIQPGENFSKGITDDQVEDLLKRDLQKAADRVKKELGDVQLTQKQMEMFVDFVFNMGTLKKFPKFTQAVLKNDLKGMTSQYKRFAGGKELTGRNSAFLKRFLTEYFGFNYAIG